MIFHISRLDVRSGTWTLTSQVLAKREVEHMLHAPGRASFHHRIRVRLNCSGSLKSYMFGKPRSSLDESPLTSYHQLFGYRLTYLSRGIQKLHKHIPPSLHMTTWFRAGGVSRPLTYIQGGSLSKYQRSQHRGFPCSSPTPALLAFIPNQFSCLTRLCYQSLVLWVPAIITPHSRT